MTITKINPAGMGGEPGSYTNGMLATNASQTLYISGQIGIDAKGVASADFSTQCRQVWSNIEAILADAGMDLRNIVKTTIFLVEPANYPDFVEVRKQVLDGHKPASTLVYVSGLVKPDWKVEIEAVAVK
ncbi:MAG: RidA family protein [Lacisediminimonas sp.]|nr:RidA family protein [Lacisediminimonas sp.]